MNFLRSLSDSEKLYLQDKYDLNISINTPKFFDYFINYSRAIGVDIIDKYIEISQFYLSLTPAEKIYHGRKLAKRKYEDENGQIIDSLYNFLNIRSKETIPDVYYLSNLRRNYNDKSFDFKKQITFNTFRKMPFLTERQLAKVISKPGIMGQKISYMKYIIPINQNKVLEFVKRTKERMLAYNIELQELLDGYDATDPVLENLFGSVIQDLKKYSFGKRKVLDIKGEEVTGGETFVEINPIITKKNQNSKKFNEKQIKSRIELLRIARDKIINSAIGLKGGKTYSDKYSERIDEKMKRELNALVNKVLKDNPVLKAYYIDRIETQLSKFKYTELKKSRENFKLEEKQLIFSELVEDLIQKELNYTYSIKKVRTFIKDVEDKFDTKIDKENLTKVLSAYDVMDDLNLRFKDMFNLQSIENRIQVGSPVHLFFENIKDAFDIERNKIEILKDEKVKESKEYSIDEVHNKRKELIEDYTNSIATYEMAKNKKLKSEVEDELQSYKLQNMEFIEKEKAKKRYELSENDNKNKDIEINEAQSNIFK